MANGNGIEGEKYGPARPEATPAPEAGMEVPREEGFEAAPKPEQLEKEPAAGVEHEVVKGEELRETVDQKREKVDGLKREAEGLIGQVSSKENREAAEQEFARLGALSEENSKVLDYYRIGLKEKEEFGLNADLVGWTEFVSRLKGADEKALEGDSELKRRKEEFAATYKGVEYQIDYYNKRRDQEEVDHRRHLGRMADSIARFRL